MCPRRAEQNQQIKDERRRELLDAARVVFGRKGFAAAKITDVAAQAGISYGLLYHYFPDKEALFVATIEASAEGWEALFAQARARKGTPWSRLEHVCEQMVTGLRDHPEHLLMMVHACADDTAPGVRAAIERIRQKTLDDLEALVEEGQRAGEVVSGAPADLTRAVLAMVQGLALHRLVEPGRPLPPLDVMWRILKAPQGPAGGEARSSPEKKSPSEKSPQKKSARRKST